MNNVQQGERNGHDQVTYALIVGFFAGAVLAIVTGISAGNAFGGCGFGIPSGNTSCETNVSVAFAFGIGTFVAVMLQAYIIGKILETNALVITLASVTLNQPRASQTSRREDSAHSTQRDENENNPPSNTLNKKFNRTFGAWWFRVLVSIHLLYVIPIASVMMFARESTDVQIWDRILYSAVHPVAALALLALLLPKRPTNAMVLSVTVILLANILADTISAMIEAADNGAWAFPVMFSVVPAIAITYVIYKSPSDDSASEQPEIDEVPASD